MLEQLRNFKTVFATAFLVIGSLFIIWMFIGVTLHPNPQKPAEITRLARVAWNRNDYKAYQMNVVFFGHFNPFKRLLVTVQNKRVVKVQEESLYNTNLTSTPEYKVLPMGDNPEWYKSYSGFMPPSLDNYTVDQLFDFISEKQNTEPPPSLISWCGDSEIRADRYRYKVRFDETRSYPSSLIYTDCVEFDFGGGLMCGIMPDCSRGISISNLEPIL